MKLTLAIIVLIALLILSFSRKERCQYCKSTNLYTWSAGKIYCNDCDKKQR